MYEKLLSTINEKGITKYRLAKMSNIKTQDIYSAINGNKPLYPNWRKRIAEALNMSEKELFEEKTFHCNGFKNDPIWVKKD